MDETDVVTAFLRNRDDILLLERSNEVGSYPGMWGGVAGHTEDDPDRAVLTEIDEETGIDPGTARLVRTGDPFPVVDEDRGTRWHVHPYLFEVDTRAIDSNWETRSHEWVRPTAILRRETVPDLWRSYDRVRPTVETIAADTDHGSTTLSYRALSVLRDEAGLRAVSPSPHDGFDAVRTVACDLRDARPAMAVLTNRINRAMATAEVPTPEAVETAADGELDRARGADEGAARTAAELVDDVAVGTLSRSGTVDRTLDIAAPDSLLVAESRPGREGIGVAERFADRTAVTLTTDAGFGDALATSEVSALLVGADSILPDGTVVNKVGTRTAATVATHEGIDVYVIASTDKVSLADFTDLEQRDPTEVYDGTSTFRVDNPTFDRTDSDCIDGYVTEDGVLDPDDISAVADTLAEFASWHSVS